MGRTVKVLSWRENLSLHPNPTVTSRPLLRPLAFDYCLDPSFTDRMNELPVVAPVL
jgi:hypothetical protein